MEDFSKIKPPTNDFEKLLLSNHHNKHLKREVDRLQFIINDLEFEIKKLRIIEQKYIELKEIHKKVINKNITPIQNEKNRYKLQYLTLMDDYLNLEAKYNKLINHENK